MTEQRMGLETPLFRWERVGEGGEVLILGLGNEGEKVTAEDLRVAIRRLRQGMGHLEHLNGDEMEGKYLRTRDGNLYIYGEERPSSVEDIIDEGEVIVSERGQVIWSTENKESAAELGLKIAE